MIKEAIVEMLRSDELRQVYNPKDNTFSDSKYRSLLFDRGYKGHYGWIKGTGTPPNKHLDIMIVTDKDYNKGDIIPLKIVGVFLRNDGDHKIVGIEPDRSENDFEELTEDEKNNLKQIYTKLRENEGWFGKETAEKIVNEFEQE